MADTTQTPETKPARLDTFLDLLRNVFLSAVHTSTDILQILENLYKNLQNKEVPEEESQVFYDFLDGLRGCLEYRRQTFTITNIVTYINITLLYIICWLNSLEKDIDVFLISRRKALESDLLKILKKSLKNDYLLRRNRYSTQGNSSNIRDRFGCLFIILNQSDSIQRIYEIYNSAVLGILCSKNRKLKNDFIEWVKTHPNIPRTDKDLIINILQIPFTAEHIKDFIKSPKRNGYQTLQCTLRIEMYSDILPGAMMEVQIRNYDMHINAVEGSASHKDYKEEFDGPEFDGINLEKLANVFTINDSIEKKVNIPGFAAYDGLSIDLESDLREVTNPGDWDGILYPKVFFDRHVSSSLVPNL